MRWIAIIAGLTLLTLVLAFCVFGTLFAAGTNPADPSWHKAGLMEAGLYFLAIVAIWVGFGLLVHYTRNQLKTERSLQAFPGAIKMPNASNSSGRDKNSN